RVFLARSQAAIDAGRGEVEQGVELRPAQHFLQDAGMRLDRVEGPRPEIGRQPDAEDHVPQRPREDRRVAAVGGKAALAALVQIPDQMRAYEAGGAEDGEAHVRYPMVRAGLPTLME